MSEPKLRADLVVSRQETPAGVVHVIKDPHSGRFFRLEEAEYAVARRLDGATPLDAVARTVTAGVRGRGGDVSSRRSRLIVGSGSEAPVIEAAASLTAALTAL